MSEFKSAWGYEDDGKLEAFSESTKPRVVKGHYSSAWLAMGYKPVRVVIIRERDFNKIIRKLRASLSGTTK